MTKASPEEIIRMDDESRLYREIKQYSRSAETHLRLGNLQSAISAYSKAIDLMPTPDRLIARGIVYERQMDVLNWEHRREPADLAFKDFSDAIALADSMNLEKEARFGRLRVYSKDLDTAWWDVFEQDLEWLKASTEGREYGEVLFWEVKAYEGNVGYCRESPNEAFASLDRAIQLGYAEPDAFYLRACSSFHACNYGLALRDIDEAINRTEAEDKNLVEFLCRRAEILFAMNRLQEAYQALSRGRQLQAKLQIEEWSSIDERGFDEDSILCRYALEYEFGSGHISELMSIVLKVLALWKGRRLTGRINVLERNGRGWLETETITKTGLEWLEEDYPGILHAIRKIVGKKLWLSMVNDTHLSFTVELPDIQK